MTKKEFLTIYRRELLAKLESMIDDASRAYDAGVMDCKRGIYDPFYRYHKTDGNAYDAGWGTTNIELQIQD